MNTKFLVIRFLATITLASSCFTSCDDDISEVGAGALIGSQLFIEEASDFTITSGQIDITKPQTNNLDYYLIGDANNGFGDTKYSILTQVNSYSVLVQDSYTETTDNTSDVKYELVGADLVIPFRYNLEDDEDLLDDDSNTQQYNIESNILGESITFDVYESTYLIQTRDPNNLNGTAQIYYGDGSNGEKDFGDAFTKNSLITNHTLNFSDIDNSFSIDLTFDSDDDGEDDTEYSAEGISNQFQAIRITFPDDFKARILEIITSQEDENEDGVKDIDLSLIDDPDFTSEVFRGLYIETTSEDGIVEALDFDESFVNAGIQLKFKKTTTYDDLNDDSNDSEATEDIITTLQFSQNPINILEKSNTIELPSATNNDEIILQSGLGRIGTIDLFTGTEELSNLREDAVLLNNAILELTVNPNSDFFPPDEEDLPDAILITKLEDGSVLTDYTTNLTTVDEDNEILKEGHLISIRDENDDIIKDENGNIVYKINITEHLANILRQEPDVDTDEDLNVLLALSVSEDLNITSTSDIYNPEKQQAINQGTLLCFKSVPLYGSNSEFKPRLTIKYTPTK